MNPSARPVHDNDTEGRRATTRRVSVIIPARNEGKQIADLIRSVFSQQSCGVEIEILIVDNGSTDNTMEVSRQEGARVLELALQNGLGNPAAARNLGAAEATGDPIIFLDADCLPQEGWLGALLRAHDRGEVVVGGPLDLPSGLSLIARTDYYGGWYHVHSRRRAGYVPSHPPGNISVRRAAFENTQGFIEEGAAAYSHEELAWQAELQAEGHSIYFEPRAIVLHFNRPGFTNLLRRSYRWGYGAVETKAETGTRMAWIYRYPRTLVVASLPIAFAHTAYILGCWLRARRWEALLLSPLLLAARMSYSTGMAVGTARWLRFRRSGQPSLRPRWE